VIRSSNSHMLATPFNPRVEKTSGIRRLRRRMRCFIRLRNRRS
jgi:hypothetical protein